MERYLKVLTKNQLLKYNKRLSHLLMDKLEDEKMINNFLKWNMQTFFLIKNIRMKKVKLNYPLEWLKTPKNFLIQLQMI